MGHQSVRGNWVGTLAVGLLTASCWLVTLGTSPAIHAETSTQNPEPRTQTNACPGDLTGSLIVDGTDLLILLAAWGPCNTPREGSPALCIADLTGDGEVGGLDLLILLNNWGPCSPNDSCYGNCAGQAASGCWCDASCIGQGDCCNDACAECGHCVSGDSCAGNCGGQSPSGCWCDSECVEFGDCCGDVCIFCNCHPANHCEGHCGERSPVGCWCDELCHLAGDCCDDACSTCNYCF